MKRKSLISHIKSMRGKRTITRLFMQTLCYYAATILIPLLILCCAIVIVINRHVSDQARQYSNVMLERSVDTLDSMLGELNTISLTFSSNHQIYSSLKQILENPYLLEYDNHRTLAMMRNFLDSPYHFRYHIHSIYVYLDGYDAFLTSGMGLRNFDNAGDTGWYDSYAASVDTVPGPEMRTVASSGQEVLTVYRPVFGYGSPTPKGVVVVNINADEVYSLLESATIFSGQQTLMVDDEGNILIGGDLFDQEVDVLDLLARSADFPEVELDGVQYTLASSSSPNFHLAFLSMIPNSQVYELSNRVITMLVAIALLALCSGIILAVSFTWRSTRQLNMIVEIVEAAERQVPFPAIETGKRDTLLSITKNILRVFVENSYMKIQLREKMYQYQIMAMSAFQMQLNPHFLFNTLDSINWKVIKQLGSYSRANEMIADLSDLLRYSLSNPMIKVPLSQDISACKVYLDIMVERYPGKFTVDWRVAPDTGSFYVIRLLLQPLIENAIYHGFKPKDGPGVLRIRICPKGDSLVFRLTDNGAGIDRARLREVRELLTKELGELNSVGLTNTCWRLKLVYGPQAAVRIYSRENFGTVVAFSVPLSSGADRKVLPDVPNDPEDTIGDDLFV